MHLNMLPLGLSTGEITALQDFCRLASRRACTWGVTDNIDDAAGVIALANTGNALAACLHFQSFGGCIVLLDTGLCDGVKSVKGPMQLRDAFLLFDYTQRNSKANGTLRAHLATQDLLQSFVTEVKNVRPLPESIPQKAVGRNANATPVAIAPKAKTEIHRLSVNAVNQRPQVLIVDDSQVAQKYMENCLQRLGHACDVADSGDEALVLISRHAYSYVFLDVNMAGLDGYQTCRAIKSFKGHPSPPSVFITTSRVGAIDKIRGTLAGCDAYLTKPINQVLLLDLLGRLALPVTSHAQQEKTPYLRTVGNGSTGL